MSIGLCLSVHMSVSSVNRSVSVCHYVCVCLSVGLGLSVHRSVSVHMSVSVCPQVCVCLSIGLCLFVHRPVSVCLSIGLCLSVHRYVSVCKCPSVCPSISPSVFCPCMGLCRARPPVCPSVFTDFPIQWNSPTHKQMHIREHIHT